MTEGESRAPLLFDTQAVILWAINQVPQNVVRQVAAKARIYVSIASLWEFSLKEVKQKSVITYDQFVSAIKAMEADILPVESAHINVLRQLPVLESHKDPFDRMILAQTISEHLVLVGGDRHFAAYQKFFSFQILWN